MAPTFSNPTKVVRVVATVNSDATRYATDADVRRVTEDALRRAARDNGVTVEGIEVTVETGPRTVTLTEDEYNALRAGNAPAQ